MNRVVLGSVVGKVWNLPNTVIGIAYGLLGYGIGNIGFALRLTQCRPTWSLGHNAIQFHGNPLTVNRCAITIGNTVSYGGRLQPEHYGAFGDPTVNVGRHEEAHTRQSEILGILFLPAYLAAGGFTGPLRNRFERAAQDYGRGGTQWWPW
ncbi:hypothetical protein ACXYTJ_10030 [Gilvimarinus sp. F26214L]|uniref:hypothetical protein n=1 Tax=Gilvimarinus sp. DZF01 TaxID=3461371 RepID=UPI004045EB48